MNYRFGVGGFALLIFFAAAFYTLQNYSQTLELSEDTDSSAEESNAYAAAALLAQSEHSTEYLTSSSTPQFVILSFDGSKSLAMLNETLDFEHKLASEGKSLRFTYFINAAYFLTKSNAKLYQGPHEPRGLSNIGFSNTAPDIASRVKAFNEAYQEGNEIGSHSVGHFNGVDWSYDDWEQEFVSFAALMADVQKNNLPILIDKPLFLASIKGFRAPELGFDNAMYDALKNSGFEYDTSGVGRMGSWPKKDTGGVWRIPIGSIVMGANRAPVVAMDYSIWAHQSNNVEVAKAGTPLWTSYKDDVVAAYMNYFNSNYNGSRAPVVIGHHFSKWNDGVYWESMKTFAEQVCGLPNVRCVTYRELVQYLNTVGPPLTLTRV
jgi:hypothetical protein